MMPQGRRDPKSRALIAAGVLIAAVLVRSWFFLRFDESYFDSDQAIVGLMAKHLVEGRAFPLFFYGQEYMLAVESWLMAPIFVVLGPSVFALRLTLVLIQRGAWLAIRSRRCDERWRIVLPEILERESAFLGLSEPCTRIVVCAQNGFDTQMHERWRAHALSYRDLALATD